MLTYCDLNLNSLIVSKWSSDEVVDWLTNVVHLPQYAETFKNNKVNGHYLPRYMHHSLTKQAIQNISYS